VSIKEPMCASHHDPKTLKFPVYASPKLDGIRCFIQGGRALARSMKEIPNVRVQEALAGLPDGIDGELIMGNPTDRDEKGRSVAFRRTSVVMRDDEPIVGLVFYVFDHAGIGKDEPFKDRLKAATAAVKKSRSQYIGLVAQALISDLEELYEHEAGALSLGYEGLMLRDPNGPYKEGRSTSREGWLLKVKRFKDSEAEVLGMEELMHNDNTATTNERGRTQRSTIASGLRPGGVMGALLVKDVKSGVEFSVGTGFDDEEREAIWKNQSRYIGRIVKYKYFPVGGKDKPRHPVFLAWRDRRDMGARS
jgi:DNA ligase-1